MKYILYKILEVIFVIFLILKIGDFNKCFAKEDTKEITVLFTHDMHDHAVPSRIVKENKILETGGYARLKKAIDIEKDKDKDAVLVDGGDFSMGMLFQSIYDSDCPELRLLGSMGYDVTTFGNHEFDFRAKGLSGSLNAAIKSLDKVPQIVQSNMIFPKDNNGKLSDSLNNLKESMDRYGVKDYTVLNKKGLKIGVFGLMGKDAASNAPMSEVKFNKRIDNAKRVTQILKEKENVDLIICLSHSGINEDKSKSEDEILAKKVSGIDLIISGHTHSTLKTPIKIGDTVIVCCGEYVQNLGIIKMKQKEDKSWEIKEYTLKPIDSTLLENKNILNKVNYFKKIVQKKYLNKFNMKFDEILGKLDFNFTPLEKLGEKHKEEPLGNFISDAYMYGVKKAEGENYKNVYVAIVPVGTIRGSFVKGNVKVSDVFTVSSLGMGKDGSSGYPLVSAYLNGKELKTVCEIDASIQPIMESSQLYMSGISYTFNSNRIIFNKVTDVKLQKDDGTYEKIEDNKLYRIVSGLYSAQMLSTVKDKSFGLLKIVPKDEKGIPIKNFESRIIYKYENNKKSELKEWVAIAEYIKSFQKVRGVSMIPSYYKSTHNRKIVLNDKSIFKILSKPNKIVLGFYAITIIIISLIVFVAVKIKKYKK